MNPFPNLFKFLIFVLLFFSLSYASQNGAFSSATVKMSKSGKAPSEIRFSEGKEMQLSSFWAGYMKAFNLSQNNDFKSFKIFSDKIGQTHHRYEYYDHRGCSHHIDYGPVLLDRHLFDLVFLLNPV